MDPQPLLTATELALIQGPVSINVAARSADLTPCVARALGCRVEGGGQTITLFLSRTTGSAVLDCLGSNGAIAAVFSRPSTHETLQLKGVDASLIECTEPDLMLIQAYRRRFASDLATLGYTDAFADAVVAIMPDLVAVRFTPTAAFQQTPGPSAGQRLGQPPCA
jgi:hypothetical protein